jgi:hypothetical protein
MALQTWNQTLYSMPATAAAVTAASATDLVPNADFTFPAQFFYIGQKFRVKASGVASTTSGSNTMTFALQLGATVINASFGAITFIASQTAQKWALEIVAECRAIGAGTSTTFVATGVFVTSTALLAVCTQMLPASGAIAAGTGVDATATQKLSLYGTWSAVSNSITVEQYEVTLLN